MAKLWWNICKAVFHLFHFIEVKSISVFYIWVDNWLSYKVYFALRRFTDHQVSDCLESCNHGAQLDPLVCSGCESMSLKKNMHNEYKTIILQSLSLVNVTHSMSANLMSRVIRIAEGKSTRRQSELQVTKDFALELYFLIGTLNQ